MALQGTDGIKVIKPQKIYYSKLFYYLIRAIALPDKGYARHFQLDLLLTLAGTLESNVTDIRERHDEYIGDALLTELRGNNDE